MPSPLTFPIVGAHFRPPAKAILAVLPLGAPLLLRREPENTYDSNAIAIWCPTSSIPSGEAAQVLENHLVGYGFTLDEIFQQPLWHLGYIPAQRAKEEAGHWDALSVAEYPATLAFNVKGEPRAAVTELVRAETPAPVSDEYVPAPRSEIGKSLFVSPGDYPVDNQ